MQLFLSTHKLGPLDEVGPLCVECTELMCQSVASGAVCHLSQEVACFVQPGLAGAPLRQVVGCLLQDKQAWQKHF